MPHDGVLKLHYGYDNGPRFEEKITFTGHRRPLSKAEESALEAVFRQIHLAAGISYYKAFVPHELIYAQEGVTAAEARFFEDFYLQGLGEFAVENALDLRGHIHFRQNTNAPSLTPHTISLPRVTAVPIGGGKDSVVTLETLKAAGDTLLPICVNATQPMLDCLETAALPAAIYIKRQLDPGLFSLNKEGAYNGHVPITGILSFVMIAAGLIYGFDKIAFSNERSANQGNLQMGDLNINHQYSKSFAFEQGFSRYIQDNVLQTIKYFSFLRPLSELGIARLFAQMPAYFPVFKSCNRNFHIDTDKRQHGWCGNCPKCRFVFLALAPFVERDTLIEIFGTNMLNNADQLLGYRELTGLTGHKPFECVGEVEECQTALRYLAAHPNWSQDTVITTLNTELGQLPASQEELLNDATTMLPPHLLSDKEWDILYAAVHA
ncbi:MAG: hypothetical protein CMF31_00640 [Kordiimonas sp.]|nr:hypothetical protein [Kordiimonas sp.]